jgi:hypothetical protein
MSAGKGDLGYYAMPVLVSFEGIDKQVNDGVGKALGRLGDIGKRSGKDLGKGLGDGLKSTEAEVKKAADAYAKLRDKAADALGKIRTEEEKLAKARAGGKNDQIVAAEERLAKARRDSARASREADDGHKSLLSAQKRLGDGAGDLDGKMAGLGASMGAMAGVAAGAAVTALAALGAGAIKAARELYDLGAQFDDLRDKLQISTGASGAQLEGLVDSIERLGTTTVASSFADIGDVAVDVTRNLHLTGSAFDDVTSRIANWNRMTGEAVNVRELGKAFHGFGVDAKDQAAALNSLAGVQQATGIGINELVASMNKGGAALRQFGFGFGESAALITQLDAAGLNAEKMISGGLNKGLATLAKEGKTGAAGLREVVGQIKGLIDAGNITDAQTLTNKYFGAKGGQFLDAIQRGALDLQTLSASLQSTGVDINQLAADTSDWSERWPLLQNEAKIALEPLGTTLFNLVGVQLSALADWVSAHRGEVIDFFVTLGDASITAAEWMVKALGDAAGAIGGIIAPIGDALGALYKFEAWKADIRGDHETARQLREQAEEMFSLGEGLKKLNEASDRLDFDAAREQLHDLGEQAKTSGHNLDALRDKLEATRPAGQRGWFDFPATAAPAAAAAASATVPLTRGAGGTWTSPDAAWAALIERESSGRPDVPQQVIDANTGGNEASGLFQIAKSTWAANGGTSFAPTAGEASPQEQAVVAARILHRNPSGSDWGAGLPGRENAAALLSGLTGTPGASAPALGQVPYGLAAGSDSGGYGGGGVTFPDWVNQVAAGFNLKPSTYPGHQEGSGQNQGIDWSGSVADMQRFAEYLTQTKPQGLEQVIWQNPNTRNVLGLTPGGDVVTQPGGYYRDDWADHMNHVHTRQRLSIPMPGGAGFPAALDGLSSSASSPIDLSRNTNPAYGPGTPGVDEHGNQGFWRADPKAVREADQRAADAMDRIADADTAVALAQARLNELDADASESQRLSAQEAVRKAQADAVKARREAEDARADADEAKKGTFTEAKQADKQKAGKSGGSGEFSELGNIFGSFMKETFGLDGSLFPDISDLPAVKSLGAVLGFAKNVAGAAADQGAQTSTAGATDPFSGMADTGAGTSGLPFGMIPGVSSLLPTSPTDPSAPTVHTGGGAAPGPVDQSTHVTINNPQGDEQSIADRTRRTILKTPRLGTYSAPAQIGVG